MRKKKINLEKEEKKINSLISKFDRWYCCPDDALDYLARTGSISYKGKKYVLNENELLVVKYGRENAEFILKERMRRKEQTNTNSKNKKGRNNLLL